MLEWEEAALAPSHLDNHSIGTFCFPVLPVNSKRDGVNIKLPKSPKVYYNNFAHMAYHPVKAEVTARDLHSNGGTGTATSGIQASQQKGIDYGKRIVKKK